MAESQLSIQCTDKSSDPSGNDVLDPIADILDYRTNPEEVYGLYDDVGELVLKNQTKEEYIEELQQKIHELEQEVQGKNREITALRGQHGGETRTEIEGSDDCGTGRLDSFSADPVNRDLIQDLLMKKLKLESENQQWREMYSRILKENEKCEHLARQCLLHQEKIQESEQRFAKKEKECQAAQEKVKDLQLQLDALKESAESYSTTGFPDVPDIHLTQDDSHDSSSIHLREQMSPPLKRGRFTMEKSQFECSRCSGFFASKEEAAKTKCCYHLQMPVPAILRHGSVNVDPVNPPDVFWPCCQKIGRQAVKCARGCTHKFNSHDNGKNTLG